MYNFRQYNFVCEFRIKLSENLNSNHMSHVNSIAGNDSVNEGKYSIEGVDIDKDILSGRYLLTSEIIPETEQEYLDTMRRDLILLFKRDMDFPMIPKDAVPTIESMTTLHAVILPLLEMRKKENEKALYFYEKTGAFYILSHDRLIEGTYFDEDEAFNDLVNN